MPKRLPLLLCVLALTGCAQPRREAEKAVEKVGAEKLREAAAKLYKDSFAGHGPSYFALRENAWPAEFAALKPHHVGAYPDGFAIAVTSDNEQEAGVYVVPADSSFKLRVTPRRRFERLAEGVYWYSFDR